MGSECVDRLVLKLCVVLALHILCSPFNELLSLDLSLLLFVPELQRQTRQYRNSFNLPCQIELLLLSVVTYL